MKQIYYPYWMWEDYLNGMYSDCDLPIEEMISNSLIVLSDAAVFESIISSVFNNWPIATAVNLTNTSINRKAWLGWAACNYKYKTTEISTRIAWGRLSEIERHIANLVAEKQINEYERKNFTVHQELGELLLF